jgi:hypothetical protein
LAPTVAAPAVVARIHMFDDQDSRCRAS